MRVPGWGRQLLLLPAIGVLAAGCGLWRMALPQTLPRSTPLVIYITPTPARSCTPQPMQTEAAARLKLEGAVVVYERNGGLECRDELYGIFADGHTYSSPGSAPAVEARSPAQVDDLLARLDQTGFFGDAFFTTYHPPCALCSQYEVTVSYQGRAKTVGYVSGGTDGPPQYWIVIGLLEAFLGIED